LIIDSGAGYRGQPGSAGHEEHRIPTATW